MEPKYRSRAIAIENLSPDLCSSGDLLPPRSTRAYLGFLGSSGIHFAGTMDSDAVNRSVVETRNHRTLERTSYYPQIGIFLIIERISPYIRDEEINDVSKVIHIDFFEFAAIFLLDIS